VIGVKLSIFPRRTVKKDLKEIFPYRTVSEYDLSELPEFKHSLVRTVRGDVYGYIVYIIGDRKKRKAEKVVIKRFKEESNVKEHVVEVKAEKLIVVEGFVFIVREVTRETLQRIYEEGIPNILSEINVVKREEELMISRRFYGKEAIDHAFSSGLMEEKSEKLNSLKEDLRSKENSEPLTRIVDVLLSKELYLKNRLEALLELWFEGRISLDEYLEKKSRITRELSEVRRKLTRFGYKYNVNMRRWSEAQ